MDLLKMNETKTLYELAQEGLLVGHFVSILHREAEVVEEAIISSCDIEDDGFILHSIDCWRWDDIFGRTWKRYEGEKGDIEYKIDRQAKLELDTTSSFTNMDELRRRMKIPGDRPARVWQGLFGPSIKLI